MKSFKSVIYHHQCTDHFLGTRLPQQTPKRNQYVKGRPGIQKHNCLGKIYIDGRYRLKKRKARHSLRKDVSNRDKADPQTGKIIATALKMDNLATFNSPTGVPKLSDKALVTSHQLIGYAVRCVANEFHIFLRSSTPPKGDVKRLKWEILRGLTTWAERSCFVSRYAGLTESREKTRGRLIKFDDKVSHFLYYLFVICR